MRDRDGSYRDLERGSRDEMLNRHRHRHGDRGHHNKEEFESERHKKFLDMNRRRADRLKSQVIAAKFSPEEEASLLAEVELYHDKEFEQAEHNHVNKQKLRDEYGRMSKEQREVHRDKERAERHAIRDMRLNLEKRIQEQMGKDQL